MNVIRSGPHLEKRVPALFAHLFHEPCQRVRMAVSKHRPVLASAPGHEVVELTPIDRLPPAVQRLLHFRGQALFHGTLLIAGTGWRCIEQDLEAKPFNV